MSSVCKLFVTFIIIQSVTNVIASDIKISCPKNDIPQDPQDQQATKTLLVDSNSSCIALNIDLNVENILPDPSYISPETNINIVYNALQKTLKDNNIHANIESLDKNTVIWTEENLCPNQKDETVNKYYLETIPSLEIPCIPIPSSIKHKINDFYMECEIITPESIAYIFIPTSIKSFIKVSHDKNNANIYMKSLIMDTSKNILGESETYMIYNTDKHYTQQFSFANQNITFVENTNYIIGINIRSKNQLESKSIHSQPILITRAEPDACFLAYNIAVDPSMISHIEALYNIRNKIKNIDETAQLFQEIFYQKHSSQTFIPVPLNK